MCFGSLIEYRHRRFGPQILILPNLCSAGIKGYKPCLNIVRLRNLLIKIILIKELNKPHIIMIIFAAEINRTLAFLP